MTDRRIQRTHRRLSQALVDLTLEQGYEPVTIREITDRAQVGYATFFRHFPDKDALMAHVLERLIGELKELLQPGWQGPVEEEGRLIFEHVAANSRLYRVLLSSMATHPVLARIQESSEAEVLAQIRARSTGPGEPGVPAAIVAHHLVNAIIALIRWWLDQGEPYSSARMGQFYDRLIIGPAIALLEPRA